MTKSKIDQEIEAIRAISTALEPLDADSRQRALDYAIGHLGLKTARPPSEDTSGADVDTLNAAAQSIVDIRSLRDQKQPTTDVQMLAIVAYYLANLAPPEERQDVVTSDDLKKYFVQAGHPLPTRADLTLTNAKTAGYLDSVSRGKFRLNAVGHNLVVHNLPKSAQGSTARTRTKRSKKTRVTRTAKTASSKKKASKKKGSKKTASKKVTSKKTHKKSR